VGEPGAEPSRTVERTRRLARAAAEAAVRIAGGESVRLRAMALTYLSLFALVPALVVLFSVVQAFTGMERISARLHDVLLENLAVGARATLEPYLERFITNAHAGSAGLVGGALLIWSAVSLFSSIDRAVNDIWGIRRPRRLAQAATIYWLGLTLGPLLLAGSVALGTSARAFLATYGLGGLAVAGGVLLTCLVFAGAYFIVPDTRVRLGAAMGGGLVAGLAWEGAKWGYAIAVARFFRYNAIYGSVAAVPTFLLWLFVSWTILLFGARVAYVFQYAPTLWRGGPLAEHPVSREALAARVMLEVALAFDRTGDEAARGKGGAPDAGEVARSLRVSPEDVGDVVAALKDRDLVRALGDGGMVPGRPLDRLTLLDVRLAVLGAAPEGVAGRQGPVERALASVDELTASRLGTTTFRQLCDEERRLAAEGLAGPPDQAS
jgi:membrane protein